MKTLFLTKKHYFDLETLRLISKGGVVWWWEFVRIYPGMTSLSDYPAGRRVALLIGARR
jgi:hypothetical protein